MSAQGGGLNSGHPGGAGQAKHISSGGGGLSLNFQNINR